MSKPSAIAALLVFATACSLATDEPPATTARAKVGADRPGTATAQPPTVDGAVPTRRIDPRRRGLDVGFGEFAIALEADEIRPGPVTFVIRNGGALVHGFEIEAEDDDGDNSGSGNGELKLEGPEFGPGDTVRVTADLPPGVYELECFVGDHDDRGMRATLVVRAGAPLVRRAAPAGSDSVLVTGFAFDPAEVRIDAGDALTWTNEDPTAHTVSADDGSFDSGTMDPGGAFTRRFDEPGIYRYACAIHPAMRATVRVA